MAKEFYESMWQRAKEGALPDELKPWREAQLPKDPHSFLVQVEFLPGQLLYALVTVETNRAWGAGSLKVPMFAPVEPSETKGLMWMAEHNRETLGPSKYAPDLYAALGLSFEGVYEGFEGTTLGSGGSWYLDIYKSSIGSSDWLDLVREKPDESALRLMVNAAGLADELKAALPTLEAITPLSASLLESPVNPQQTSPFS